MFVFSRRDCINTTFALRYTYTADGECRSVQALCHCGVWARQTC